MAVTYSPTFKHLAWRDGTDKVEAGGPNGFNRRFQQIEADLSTLSTVIALISSALDSLNAAPAAQAVITTLTPMLTPVVVNGQPATAWQHEFGAAIKPAAATDAVGMMAVLLPDGVRIQSLRATGQKASGNLAISLVRHAVGATAAAEPVVSLSAPNGTFDVPPVSANAAIATVNNLLFRYYLTVQLDTASPTQAVKVSAVQIAHIAAAA